MCVGGDLNCIAHKGLDRSAGTPLHSPHRLTSGHTPILDSGLNALLTNFQLIDAWRHHNPTERDYTFFSSRHSTYTRIDYVLVSPSLSNVISAADIDIHSWSDHAPVSLELYFPALRKKTPTWVFNKTLLLQDHIVLEVKEKIVQYFKENDNGEVSEFTVWEAMKAVLRGQLIAIGAREKRGKQLIIEQLKKEIQELERQHKLTCNRRVFKQLLSKRKALEAFDDNRIQRDLMYTRQRLWKKSPKTLKVLAWRVKKKRDSKIIHAIRSAGGATVTDSDQILSAIRDFYANLYDAPPYNAEE